MVQTVQTSKVLRDQNYMVFTQNRLASSFVFVPSIMIGVAALFSRFTELAGSPPGALSFSPASKALDGGSLPDETEEGPCSLKLRQTRPLGLCPVVGMAALLISEQLLESFFCVEE